MDFLVKVGSYVIAYAFMAAIELPFWPITKALMNSLRNHKRLSLLLLVVASLDTAKICSGVLMAGWLIHAIGQIPSWLMFLIPGYFMVQNDVMRIRRVKAGSSNVKIMLEGNTEPESYDKNHDLRVEQTHLVGDVLGWIVGTNIVVQSASFF